MTHKREALLSDKADTYDDCRLEDFAQRKLESEWELEYELEIKPFVAVVTHVTDQTHQLVLDPTYNVLTTTANEFVHQKINQAFWVQMGEEIYQPYTPSFTMITDALEMIYAKLNVMRFLQQQHSYLKTTQYNPTDDHQVCDYFEQAMNKTDCV